MQELEHLQSLLALGHLDSTSELKVTSVLRLAVLLMPAFCAVGLLIGQPGMIPQSSVLSWADFFLHALLGVCNTVACLNIAEPHTDYAAGPAYFGLAFLSLMHGREADVHRRRSKTTSPVAALVGAANTRTKRRWRLGRRVRRIGLRLRRNPRR